MMEAGVVIHNRCHTYLTLYVIARRAFSPTKQSRPLDGNLCKA